MNKIISCVIAGSFAIIHSINAQQERPNILWITTEDISPQLGCYGDEHAATPFLDQLAAEGVLYENAIASAPVCAPARSSLITGMHQSSIGSHHMRCTGWFPEELKYYPQILREGGYYCTNNVKEDYNLAYESSEIWDESSSNAHWRNRKNKDQPFFAVFNYTGTHESATNSKEKHLRIVKDLPKDRFIEPGVAPLPPYFPDTPIVRELWARYYNNIAALDLYAEDLVRQLREDGLEENTIIIFYSDHGAGIPLHKRWLYDSGLKVPMIVKMPKNFEDLMPHKQRSSTDELVSFVDLPPTALNLAGLEIPQNMQGRAFLGKELSPERKYVFASRDRMDERYDMQRAVRNKEYKYIRYYEFPKPFIQYMNTPEKGDIMMAIRTSYADNSLPPAGIKLMADHKPVEELFDLKNDPYELNDLALNPAFADVLNEMRTAHKAWSTRVRDAGLIPEPILRKWERDWNMPIYKILREKDIPNDLIQTVALADDMTLFVDHLTHSNEAIRYWAAIGIGNYAPELTKVLSLKLKHGLKDTDASVRIASARALSILDDEKDAFKVLTHELSNKDEWVRLNAVLVFDELGEKSRPAIPALQSVMNDQNKYVVRVANHALNSLLDTNNEVK
jgi:uncharacterized sulfatase